MASPVAKKYKGAQLASNVPTFLAPVGSILGAAHTFPSLPTTESVWPDAQMKSAGVIWFRVSRLNLDLATYSNNMAKVISARDRLLAAIFSGDKPGITGVLMGLSKLQIDKEILKVTALPHILSDRDVLRGLTAFAATFAAVLRQKWKTSLMDDSRLRDVGMELAKPMLWTEAGAVKGAVTREGNGGMEHSDIRFHGLNEKVLRNEIETGVLKGVLNPEDLSTKAVDKTCLIRHRVALGLVQLSDMDGGVGKKFNFQNFQPSSTRAVFSVPTAHKIGQHCLTVGAILAMTLSSVQAESNMAVVSTACSAAPLQSAASISPWQLFGHIVINLITSVVVLIIVRLCCRETAEQIFVPLVTGHNDVYVTSQPSIVYHHKRCSHATGNLMAKRPCKRCAPLWLEQDEVTAGM
jgi:hypothetical protein